MDEIVKSKAEKDIENKLSSVEIGTMRYEALNYAKKYKSSWVELGETLKKVNKNGTYREWDFKSFERYCLKELHIRKETAYKMIANFNFLSDHEPSLLKGERRREIPDVQKVSILNEVKQRDDLDDTVYKNLREEAFNSAVSAMKLKKMIPPGNQETPQKREIPKKMIVARAGKQARSLKESLTVLSEVPDNIFDDIEKIIDFISSYVEKEQELQVKKIDFVE